MSLWNRQLRKLGDETIRTDPQLAEMLTQFTQRAAGQPMPTHERLPSSLAAAFGALLYGFRLAATGCAFADGWLAARLPDAAPGWSATGVWAGLQRPARPAHPSKPPPS